MRRNYKILLEYPLFGVSDKNTFAVINRDARSEAKQGLYRTVLILYLMVHWTQRENYMRAVLQMSKCQSRPCHQSFA